MVSKKGRMSYTLEEVDYGNTCIDIEYEFDYTYDPPEPMVRYYSDGSGYPGSPEQIEIYDVVCTKVCFDEYDMVPDKSLSDEMVNIFWNHQEKIEEYVAEKVYDSYNDDLSDRYDRD